MLRSHTTLSRATEDGEIVMYLETIGFQSQSIGACLSVQVSLILFRDTVFSCEMEEKEANGEAHY